jgi:hypothetical protein
VAAVSERMNACAWAVHLDAATAIESAVIACE